MLAQGLLAPDGAVLPASSAMPPLLSTAPWQFTLPLTTTGKLPGFDPTPGGTTAACAPDAKSTLAPQLPHMQCRLQSPKRKNGAANGTAPRKRCALTSLGDQAAKTRDKIDLVQAKLAAELHPNLLESTRVLKQLDDLRAVIAHEMGKSSDMAFRLGAEQAARIERVTNGSEEMRAKAAAFDQVHCQYLTLQSHYQGLLTQSKILEGRNKALEAAAFMPRPPSPSRIPLPPLFPDAPMADIETGLETLPIDEWLNALDEQEAVEDKLKDITNIV